MGAERQGLHTGSTGHKPADSMANLSCYGWNSEARCERQEDECHFEPHCIKCRSKSLEKYISAKTDGEVLFPSGLAFLLTFVMT